MKRIRFAYLLTFLLALVFLCVGSSAYVIVSTADFSSNVGSVEQVDPVCYNTSTNAYYTTIERGLSEATSGQQINVIPGTKPTITENCEVKSGVVLNIPPVSEKTVYGNPTLTFSDWSSSSGTVTFKLQKNSVDYLTWTGTYVIKTGASKKFSISCSRLGNSGTYSGTLSYSYAYLTFSSQVLADGTTSTISKNYSTALTIPAEAKCNYSWGCKASDNEWTSLECTLTANISVASVTTAANSVEYIGLTASFTQSKTMSSLSSENVSLSGSSMGTWSSSSSITIPDYSNVSNYGGTHYTVSSISGSSNSTVFVEDNVTLTNNGSIYIGGTLAAYGGSVNSRVYAGNTYGAYAQMVLGAKAYLKNNGSLYIYGYLKEETQNNGSELDNSSGAYVYAPFVVRDYKGGAITVSCYNSRTSYGPFPFNQYEVRNISCKAFYRYGCTLTCWADLYAGDQHNTASMIAISNSSSGFIQLSENAYVEAKFTESASYSATPTGKGSCTLNIYGGCTFNSMSLSITYSGFTKTVSSSDFYFPISWRFNIGFYKLSSQTSASFIASDKYQFLPGSSLTVGSGVTLSAGTLIFYKEWPASVDTIYDSSGSTTSGTVDTRTAYYDSSLTSKDAEKASAYLLNNGTVTASTFSGLIKSDLAGAKLTINDGYTSTNYQPIKDTSSSTLEHGSIILGSDYNRYIKIDNAATYSDGSTSITSTGTYTSSSSGGSYGFFA